MNQTTTASNESQQLASEIQARISSLENLFDEPLKDEMEALKETLRSNASAAALLLDTDIGLLVRHLKRTVSVAIQEASKPKEKKASTAKKKFTAEELQKALEEEGFPA